MNKLSANQLQEILHTYSRLKHPWEFIDYLRANSKPDNSLVSEDEPPHPSCIELECVFWEGRQTKEKYEKQIAVRKIYDYISENVTDYKNEPVLLADVIEWLDKEKK